MKEIDNIVCTKCGCKMKPVYFIEEEYTCQNGCLFKTGRKRKAVSHLVCENCLTNECVDDSFDEPWR